MPSAPGFTRAEVDGQIDRWEAILDRFASGEGTKADAEEFLVLDRLLSRYRSWWDLTAQLISWLGRRCAHGLIEME